MKLLRNISFQNTNTTILSLENQQISLNTKLKSLNPKHSAWLTVDAWKYFLSEWITGWMDGWLDGQKNQASEAHMHEWGKTEKIYEN